MAVDIHLHFTNGIKGESDDKEYKDHVQVLAWGINMSQSGNFHAGGGGGSGKASFSDMSITKYVDLASTELLKKLATGTHIDEAKLFVRKAGGDKPLTYLEYQLKHVMVSSYSTGGSSSDDDRQIENISLHFRSLKVIYHRQSEKGTSAGKTEMEYNIAKNETKYG